MEFNLAEKLAIVKIIDAVIHADGVIHDGELQELQQLMKFIDFDTNFIMQSRNIAHDQSLLILKAMPDDKKKVVAIILEELANSDGFVHKKEIDLIVSVFSSAGITHELKSSKKKMKPSKAKLHKKA